MTAIRLEKLCIEFGGVELYKDFSVEFEASRLTCLLGKSGCGKTTLLAAVAGIVGISSGSVSGPAPDRLSMVFQNSRLLPWKTARQNVELVLRMSRTMRSERALHYLDALGLGNHADFYPDQLSGGMQRRVALARALAYPSDAVLVDEPFDSLDLETRNETIEFFMKTVRDESRTVVCVTHESSIAHEIADRIIELDGRPVRIAKDSRTRREPDLPLRTW